jgi:hypothetical protein
VAAVNTARPYRFDKLGSLLKAGDFDRMLL